MQTEKRSLLAGDGRLRWDCIIWPLPGKMGGIYIGGNGWQQMAFQSDLMALVRDGSGRRIAGVIAKSRPYIFYDSFVKRRVAWLGSWIPDSRT